MDDADRETDPHHGGKIYSSKVSVALTAEVWRSVSVALTDYVRFGPGELDADYIPDEHLEKCIKAITTAVGEA